MPEPKKFVQVPLSPEIHGWFVREATRLGVPLSTTLRWVVEKHAQKKLEAEMRRACRSTTYPIFPDTHNPSDASSVVEGV